ncbi:SDR family NAD(P)-dependent oxidoreductase [Nocardia huaxiensis]|uniref:SDR family NAD(P)-dependent oxidoreductase n=1 Tax=Nocardia huaxiensis TaxID=2755382 RepID=A0A7D6V9M3_9NOCA|nr:SDR family NAD(P)-dependent oxidoreductase [Nocardia huaxiensis]QLY30054.1 SDR family NAD(P)-dependent oxidoreductase [Nocardia huaxiensis]UFS96348.1 SDR family NAD(P)-dependent oxidoreductase [Nocardia huaxiensis]
MYGIGELAHLIRHSLDTQVSVARLRRRHTLEEQVAGRTVLITGASSGIGRAAALRIGAAGGTVALVARRADELRDVAAEIAGCGGKADVYPCDLSDFDALDAMVAQVLADHGGVDILVNNAGRSIRRRVDESYERFHDYERTMRLNYFAATRLILALLPGMRERRYGQIVTVLSLANQFGGPGYSAYVASKAALDSLTSNLHIETLTDNVRFTSIYMPLVRTAMVAPNLEYRNTPALTPEQGAETICDAIIDRPRHIGPLMGRLALLLDNFVPDRFDEVRNERFRRGM